MSQLKDAAGTKDVVASQTYTWDGQVASQTDANGNTTKYDYDAMGHQTKITDALGNITLKFYDLLGRNTAIVAPKNYKADALLKDMEHTAFTYDAMGRVLTQTENYQQLDLDRTSFAWINKPVSITTLTNEYDTLGNVTATTDALGNRTTTSYNLAGLPEYVSDAETIARSLPFTTHYSYNGLGQKTKEEYPGVIYTYSYDGLGNPLTTALDGVNKSSATYDLLGRKISSADALGNTTRQEWNALDKVAKTITPGDATIESLWTIYQYDKSGNLSYSKDNLGTITTYTYDSLGRNLSKTVGNNSGDQSITTSTSYDLNRNITSQTDGNGNTINSTYDAMNRVLSTTNPLGQTTSFTYDANGNQTEKKDYLGNTTYQVYDGINRLVEIRDAYNNVIQQNLYNAANAQISSFDALHNETRYSYDKNLRKTGTTDGEGYLSSLTYDTRGNVSTKTDAKGNTTSYQYDGENHLLKVTDAIGNTTSYTYDVAGNVISQTDGNGHTTTYRYNAANLMISKEDPADTDGTERYSESYTYAANGKMATKLDRNGITTAYTYDSFGRLLNEDARGEVQSYTYDANGNLLTMTDATGTTTRTYDALNRNLTKDVPEIGSSTYEYDLPAATAGEYSERTTDPKGNVTFKTYDKVGRLSKVAVTDGVTKYEYYANGNQQRITYPDGTTENYSYDKDNRITCLVNAKADGTEVSSYQYEYDAAGNQTKKQEAKGITAYTYDRLNRLTSVIEPDSRVTSYTYDNAGNRKKEEVSKGLISQMTLYNYDNLNRLISTSSSDGTENIFIYDANGNLLSKSSGEYKITDPEELTLEDLPDFGLVIRRTTDYGTGSKALTTYNYDNYNRLIATESENSSSAYAYNAQGYRVEKQVNNKVTKYLYESDKVVLETDANGTQTAYQTYGNSLLHRSVAAGGEHGAEGYYYLYNAHGDVTGLLDAGGTVAATYDYDAFGNILSETGEADNSIKYAGYQYDKESGLYYLNARYYDSMTARFITEDTYTGQKNDPLSLNLYTYCSNNPIIYSDPSGHFSYSGNKQVSTFPTTTDNNSDKSGKKGAKVNPITPCTAVIIAKDTGTKPKKENEQKNPKKSTKTVDGKNDNNAQSGKTMETAQTGGGKSEVGTSDTNTYGSVITASSDKYVTVPDYPYIDSTFGFFLGVDDSTTGGMVRNALNLINRLTNNQKITKNVINYNANNTSEFKEKYKAGQAVGYLSTIVSAVIAPEYIAAKEAGNIAVETLSKAEVLAINRAQGKAFEQQEFTNFSSNYTNAAEQITIKTANGTKIRVDAIGLDANGNVVINEFKSSATAPLTPNQKVAFSELFSSGGTVVGKGKGIFTGGYEIPSGTEVRIIRPQTK